MSHHDTTIPLSVFDDDDDGGGEVQVSFDWNAGSAPSGLTGPPENYDPGAGEEFYIVAVEPPQDDNKVIAWLEENWDRPDYEAELADYRYEEYRDRMMEDD